MNCSVYNVGSWNSGEPFDYRNVLLRTGASSVNMKVQQLYSQIKPAYDNEMGKLEERKRLDPNGVFSHRDLPRCRVSDAENVFIGDARIEKIQSVCKALSEKCDIVLLQEVIAEEIFQIHKVMPDFEYCIAKDIEREKVCVDTLVMWNQKRFNKISPQGAETTQRRSTMVLLQDVTTQKVIQVASLHARGFNIIKPSQGVSEGENLAGDQDVVDMLNRANTFDLKADIKIFGGDFNSEYEHLLTTNDRDSILAQRRFKLLEEEGYIYINNSVSTCFNQFLTTKQGREDGLCVLDHLFVKSTDGGEIQGKHLDEFSYPLEDISVNPSDHRPVIFSITCNAGK